MFNINKISDLQELSEQLRKGTVTKHLLVSALLSSLAAILQAAGGYVPLVGFFISPFTSLPMIIATMMGVRYGLFTYMLTISLLVIIEPTELFIFPFTTGLLGLGIGIGFILFKHRLPILICNGILLTIGILIPLSLLQFPVFGPLIEGAISIKIVLSIFIFSLIYCLIWIEFSLIIIRKLSRLLD